MRKISIHRWLKCAICGERFKKGDKKTMVAFDGPPDTYRNIYVHVDKCLDEIYTNND